MKVAPLLALFACVLSSCVSSSGEDIPTPAGGVMHQAKCNGSPNECFRAAAKVCKGKYQVLDSSSNSGGIIADIMPGPITWYKMSYQCGSTDGRMPSFPFRGPQFVAPPIVITSPATRTTNCNRIGNSVSCTTF